MSNKYIIIDFETTGFSPNRGDRVIEVAAVLVEDGKISDKFQSLMNPSKKISSRITSYTGITNSMVVNAPSSSIAMEQLYRFLGNKPLIAHNAAFDKRFLEHELKLIGKKLSQPMACSLLVARRLYQNAPNHKLQTLIELNKIKVSGDFHRALADAEMTANLWLKMLSDLSVRYSIKDVNFELIHSLSSIPSSQFDLHLTKLKKS